MIEKKEKKREERERKKERGGGEKEGEREGMGAIRGKGIDKIKVYGLERKKLKG